MGFAALQVLRSPAKPFPGGGPPTLPEDPRTEAQILTAWYDVDCHTELGRTKPTDKQIRIIAQAVGEKLEGGAKPEYVREAIRKLVEKGKRSEPFGAICERN